MSRVARGQVVVADGEKALSARAPRVVDVLPDAVFELELAARVERQRSAIVALASAIAVRLVGDAVARDDAALSALFDEVRAALGPSARVVAHLCPDDLARLAPRLAAIGVRAVADTSRAPGSMRLDSERGTAELSIEDAVRRIAAAVDAP